MILTNLRVIFIISSISIDINKSNNNNNNNNNSSSKNNNMVGWGLHQSKVNFMEDCALGAFRRSTRVCANIDYVDWL